MFSSYPWNSSANFVGICCIKVVVSIVVAVEGNRAWDLCVMNLTGCAFRGVSMFPKMSRYSSTNFIYVDRVEVVSTIPISVERDSSYRTVAKCNYLKNTIYKSMQWDCYSNLPAYPLLICTNVIVHTTRKALRKVAMIFCCYSMLFLVIGTISALL